MISFVTQNNRFRDSGCMSGIMVKANEYAAEETTSQRAGAVNIGKYVSKNWRAEGTSRTESIGGTSTEPRIHRQPVAHSFLFFFELGEMSWVPRRAQKNQDLFLRKPNSNKNQQSQRIQRGGGEIR